MSWIEDISTAIKYIDNHLLEDITVDDVAKQIHLSTFYFQKAFSILCGFSVSEYIRNRRLSLAGRDLQLDGMKVIDVAYRYGYDSPDSFSKAFARFHGISPIEAKNGKGELRNFLPLKLQVSMKGGFEMECKIVKKPAFTVVGCCQTIKNEEGFQKCPQMWDEFYAGDDCKHLCGYYGICIDENVTEGYFKYLIADDYLASKEYPEHFETITIPQNSWAIFPCVGPLPKALQEKTVQIFKEWLPQNSDYKIAAGYNIELYSDTSKYPKGVQDENYYTEIWIPVVAKA